MQRLRDQLQASDLRWLSGYLSIKESHSAALWWHQDWWCWDHPVSFSRATTQVAVLCYLTGTSEENGALRVMPKSHHQSMPLHRHLPEPHGDDANRLPPDHPAMLDCPGQRTVPARAGDAVLLDYRLLHGTHPNNTPYRRDCILLSFIPNWSRLSADLQAHCMMHPALPCEEEAPSLLASGYSDLVPQFAGIPASIAVNRLAPADFFAR